MRYRFSSAKQRWILRNLLALAGDRYGDSYFVTLENVEPREIEWISFPYFDEPKSYKEKEQLYRYLGMLEDLKYQGVRLREDISLEDFPWTQ